MKILKTTWDSLVMINYEVDRAYLEPHVPAGCVLDLYNGRAMLSVVAFEFSKTRIFGVPMPLYRSFPEVNLRIYVKRMVDGEWRRAVVFIKEIIPYKFPAWVGRTVFRENYHVMPVRLLKGVNQICYEWGDANQVAGKLADRLHEWGEGTEEEFIGDNFWAFKRLNDYKTLEFHVTHRPWKMCHLMDLSVDIDFEGLYGEEIGRGVKEYGGKPTSVFYVDGSEVEVTAPRSIEKN